jgi:hypothetical protein
VYKDPKLYGKPTTDGCAIYLPMKFTGSIIVTHFAVLAPYSIDNGPDALICLECTVGIKDCIPFVKYANTGQYLKPIKRELSLYNKFPKDPF